MFSVPAALAELLRYAAADALASATDPLKRPRPDFEQPIGVRVAALHAEITTLRQVLAEHGQAHPCATG